MLTIVVIKLQKNLPEILESFSWAFQMREDNLVLILFGGGDRPGSPLAFSSRSL